MSNEQRRYQRSAKNTAGEFSRRRDIWGLLKLDATLSSLILFACLTGLIALYSASDKSLAITLKQGSSMMIGWCIMIIFARIPPTTYSYVAPYFYAFGVVLLMAVAVVGEVRMGAQRWISIPGVTSVQPSEFLKTAMPMMLAWYLSQRPLPISFKDLCICLGLTVIPFLLIAEQPDLGTSLLVFASGLFVIFFAGISWKIIAGLGVVVASILPIAWTFLLHDYQRRRVLTLIDPESDPLGNGWNIIQSKTAIGSGGVTGKGWLDGTQSHLHFLPEGHTDFIIAAFSEEFGLLGVLLLMGLYIAILLRALHIARHAQTTFNRLLAGAITLSFFVYVTVNVGMVSGILPVVGVPLPFISYGGTAILTLMSGFGILMSIHAHRRLMS